MYRIIALILLIVSTLFLSVGCVSDKSSAKQQGIPKQAITIVNDDRTLVFDKIPERAVSLSQSTTEIMLALGLEKYMVGTAALMEPTVLPEFRQAYETIPVIAEHYPSREALLGVEPDFVYGRKEAFTVTRAGRPEDIFQYGIKVYVVQATVVTHPTMKDVYDDINNIGKIFQVEGRSGTLIKQMQAQIDGVRRKVSQIDRRLTVAVFDSSQKNQVYVAGQSLESELIKLAGGDNVFQDLDRQWAMVGYEEIINRNPDVIVINEYNNITGQSKIDQLLANPALADVTAIKKHHFVIVTLNEVYEGVRNAQTVEKLARGFYPELFAKE